MFGLFCLSNSETITQKTATVNNSNTHVHILCLLFAEFLFASENARLFRFCNILRMFVQNFSESFRKIQKCLPYFTVRAIIKL